MENIMAIHIIIDGYNLIRQSRRLSELDRLDLQLGRENLLKMLAAYKKIKRHRMTVVFDGIDACGLYRQRDRVKGVAVIFSRQGESADDLIKRMVTKEGQKTLVVSSDREVSGFAEANGAATIGSPEFLDKLDMAEMISLKGAVSEEEMKGWKPTTRKKGPRRRLSKKERRNRRRMEKL
jgi:predicted RNA-binding protein with PIN domain